MQLKVITIRVKEFKNSKSGASFFKGSIKGKYIPLVLAEEEEYYEVKVVGYEFEKEGTYQIAYELNNIWIDSRANFKDKHILRIKAKRVLQVA